MQQYYTNENIRINDSYYFNEEDAHHIQNVLRLKKGEIVRLIACNGVFFLTIDYENRKPFGHVLKEDKMRRDLGIEVILIQGVIKLDNFELILQKACELGVTKIIPLFSQYTNINKETVAHKIERWNKIVLTACKQCKRESLLEILPSISLKECSQYQSECNFVAYENVYDYNNQLLNHIIPGKSVTIIIGCEGGFSSDEIAYLNNEGFQSVGLGKRILKAETAAIMSLSQIVSVNESKESLW